MKVQLTVIYEDGTSGIIEIDKPPGALPDSFMTLGEGLLAAEKTGKVVSRIGRTKVNPFSRPGGPLVLDEQLATRQEVIEGYWGKKWNNI